MILLQIYFQSLYILLKETISSTILAYIKYRVYKNINRCSVHKKILLNVNEKCSEYDISGEQQSHSKISTRKEIIHMDLLIDVFQIYHYIPSVEKFSFQLAHVKILETNQHDKKIIEAFKIQITENYVKNIKEYAEIFTAGF